MTRQVGRRPDIIRVFGAPFLLAVISAIGLVAAFGFGQLGQVLCWLGVGSPIAVVGWFGLRRSWPQRRPPTSSIWPSRSAGSS